LAAASLIVFAGAGLAFGAVSATAAPRADPSPLPTTQIGFTVPSTSSPSPSPSSTHHGGGGGSTGGGGSGDTPPPACVPTAVAPKLTPDPAPSPLPLTLDKHTVSQSADVLVKADGFQAGEKVVIALYPSPVKLGTFTVRSTGQVYAVVTIPKRTQLGTHTIQVTGLQDCRVAAASLEVVSPRGSGSTVFPWIVWVVGGCAVGLSALGLLIAGLLGWLPNAFAVGVAVRAAQ